VPWRLRPPILAPVAAHPGDVVGRYQAALAAGDAEAAVATFEPDGYYREPMGPSFAYRGARELGGFFSTCFGAGGGIGRQHCAVTDDGVRCALEYNCVRWGSHDLPPQAGIGGSTSAPRTGSWPRSASTMTSNRPPGARERPEVIIALISEGGTPGCLPGATAAGRGLGSFLTQLREAVMSTTETSFGSVSELADAMRRAEAAHGQHEKRIGAADPDWPDWYAAYMVAEQAGTELPT
jgi:hypothetical protein